MTALGEMLAQGRAAHATRVALVSTAGVRLTYAELDREVARAREALLALGVSEGARVGLSLRNNVEAYVAVHAVLAAGAACVPVDAETPLSRHAAIYAESCVTLVLSEPHLCAGLAQELAATSARNALVVPVGGAPHQGVGAALAATSRSSMVPRAAPSELAFIQYTSGSTGKPKGVMLSRDNVAAALAWYAEAAQASAEDCFASHANWQLSVTLYNALLPGALGAAVVLIDERVRKMPRELVRCVTELGVSRWMCSPSVLRFIERHGEVEPGVHRLAARQLVGGEVMPPALAVRVSELFPQTTLRAIYASTETSGCTLYEPTTNPLQPGAPAPIGRPVFGVEMKVVDHDGRELRDAVGELWVVSRSVSAGYLNDSTRDGDAFVVDARGQRWFRTRDLGVHSADGTFAWVGRADRTVKRWGYRVALEEIEACLSRHAGLAESAVVACPNEGRESDLELCAFVVPRPGKPPSHLELKAFCAAALPLYMIPDRFVRLDALPRTPNAKVDVPALSRAAAEG